MIHEFNLHDTDETLANIVIEFDFTELHDGDDGYEADLVSVWLHPEGADSNNGAVSITDAVIKLADGEVKNYYEDKMHAYIKQRWEYLTAEDDSDFSGGSGGNDR